jgi:choline-sulfatase
MELGFDRDVQPRAALPDRPNVLFILADQHRFDAVGCYGDNRVKTPNLDRLAAHGVRFENCYTPQSVCTPCRASILTGRYPHDHRLTRNVYDVPTVFGDPQYDLEPNWPRMLQQAGYVTGYIGKWHMGDDNPGFFNDWQGYNSLKPHWLGEPDASPYRADVETDAGIAFLEKHRDEPFVLCQSYYPPHTPFTAPKRFHERYEDSGLEPMAYYAAVSAIDENVGRLLAKLEALGLRERTVVIYTSEHGETFGRRPGGRHKTVCYEESAKVPLILSAPSRLPGGRVHDSGVTSCSIMPTILELSGVPVPDDLHGPSLVGRLHTGSDNWSEPVFIQNLPGAGINGGTAVERAVRTRRWKLITRLLEKDGETPPYELYDLNADPNETRNLFYDRGFGNVVRRHCRLLESWGYRVNDPVAVRLARAAGAQAGSE